MAAKIQQKTRKDKAFSAKQEATPVTPEVPHHVAQKQTGVSMTRHFTRAGEHPFSQLEWKSGVLSSLGRTARSSLSSTTSRYPNPGLNWRPMLWSQNIFAVR